MIESRSISRVAPKPGGSVWALPFSGFISREAPPAADGRASRPALQNFPRSPLESAQPPPDGRVGSSGGQRATQARQIGQVVSKSWFSLRARGTAYVGPGVVCLKPVLPAGARHSPDIRQAQKPACPPHPHQQAFSRKRRGARARSLLPLSPTLRRVARARSLLRLSPTLELNPLIKCTRGKLHGHSSTAT